MADHVLADAGLAGVDAEFEAVRRECGAPHIGLSRLIWRISSAKLLRNGRPPGLAAVSFSCPEDREPLAMPGEDSVRLDDAEGGAPFRPSSAKPSPQEPVERGQFRLLHRALQDAKLMAESEDLKLECGAAAKRRELYQPDPGLREPQS